jgi:DNA-directed RNA polymerase subunit M/transcription elongation factor TFIIS
MSDGAHHHRTNWATVPTILVVRPACPFCGHEKYDRTKTRSNDDGSATKLCTCRSCGANYKICEENPESGLDVIWTE